MKTETISPETLHSIRHIAANFRADEEHAGTPRATHGFVVLHLGAVTGWICDLESCPAKGYVPGVIAVAVDGSCHRATGGDEINGAAEWTPIAEGGDA